MFENIMNFFKKLGKFEKNNKKTKSKQTAKERLHLVLMQDRANVSADFLEMMKQEIIEVIKKYIEVDEKEIDVRLTNDVKEDGTTGAPSLYANIPIMNIKNEMKKEVETKAKEEENIKQEVEEEKKEESETEKKQENIEGVKEEVETTIDEEKEPEEEKTDNQQEVKVEQNEEDKKEENNENKSGE